MSPILLDSNLVIYAAQPSDVVMVGFLEKQSGVYISEITFVETLGYHRIQPDEVSRISAILEQCRPLALIRDIIDQAVGLRQQKKMSLGDALIASTALAHHLTLAARNSSDFRHISGLSIVDPYSP